MRLSKYGCPSFAISRPNAACRPCLSGGTTVPGRVGWWRVLRLASSFSKYFNFELQNVKNWFKYLFGIELVSVETILLREFQETCSPLTLPTTHATIRRASRTSSVHPMQACSSMPHAHTPRVQSRGRFANRHASMRRN